MWNQHRSLSCPALPGPALPCPWTLLPGCSLHSGPHLPSCLVGQLPPLISSGSSNTMVGDIPSHPQWALPLQSSLPLAPHWTVDSSVLWNNPLPHPKSTDSVDSSVREDSSPCGWKLNPILLGSPGGPPQHLHPLSQGLLSRPELFQCRSLIPALALVPRVEHTPDANFCFPCPGGTGP